jgi:diguanylate cyclase (GGDEF)-like protein/PAS domain S-box-containing protein
MDQAKAQVALCDPGSGGPGQRACTPAANSPGTVGDPRLLPWRGEEPASTLRALALHAPDWDYWLGQDGRYRYVSPACEAVCGHPPQAFFDDPGLMGRLLHPDDRPLWERHLAQALSPEGSNRLGRHRSMELRLLAADGSVRWIEHSCVPVVDQGGAFKGRRGVNRDISRRKDAESALARITRHLATLSAFNHALPRAPDRESMCGELCRIAVALGGLAGCITSLAERDGAAPRPLAHAGLPPELVQRMPICSSPSATGILPTEQVWWLGAAPVCTDCSDPELDGDWRDWAAAAGVRACYHEALYLGGHRVGIASFFADSAQELEPACVDLLRELAAELSFGLDHLEQREREHAHLEALARGEGRLRALIQAAPVGVAVVQDGQITEVNECLCDLAGYPRATLVGGSLGLLFPGDGGLGTIERRLAPGLAQGGIARIDASLERADGERAEVALGAAVLDPARPGHDLIYTVLDLTESRRAQALLEARVALSAVAAGGDLEALLRSTLERAERLTRSAAAFFHFVDPDQGHLLLHAWSDRALAGGCRAAEPGQRLPLDEAGVWADCIRQRAPAVHNDDRSLTGHRGLAEGDLGLKRGLIVPVVRGGLAVAVLGVGNKPVDYTQSDLELAGQLADMAMDMADGLRADAALREANARLLEAQSLARVGHWRLRVEDGRLDWSPQLYEIFGLDQAGPPPDLSTLPDLLDPQDRPDFDSAMALALAEGTPFARDWRVRRPDGTLRHVHTVCDPQCGSAGEGSERPSELHGTVQDITERKLAEEALAQARQRLELALDGGDLGLYDGDLAEGTANLDARYLGMLGYRPGDLAPTMAAWRALVHPEDRPRIGAALEGLGPGREDRLELEYRVRHRSGRWVWVLDRARVHDWDGEGRPRRIAGTHLDITDRREAEEHLRLAARVFESTGEAVLIVDAAGRIVAVNRAFVEITGYPEAEVLGRDTVLLRSDRHDRGFYRRQWAQLRKRGQWRGEIWGRRRSGEVFPVWLTIASVDEPGGHTGHYVVVFSDIAAIKRSEEELEHLAHHDALTGLPNRLLLRDRLDHAVRRAGREGRALALLFVDLDGFKGINDSLGHALGDRLLIAVAERLRGRLRGGDTLARLGGDEFLAVLEDDPSLGDATALAAALLELLAEPFPIDGHELYISASIGISLFPADGRDPDSLLRSADLAMYRAKAAGRNSFQLYVPELTERARERHELENALRGALARGELLVHYQPQVEIGSGRLVGLEALARWRHPSRGLVPPARFIPIAEEIGIVGQIGDWVLETACRQVAAWRAGGFAVERVSVNVSIRQLERESLLEAVRRVLERTGLPPGDLELEVTESMIMGQSRRAEATLDALRRLGVCLAVDDFGTGYSSLGRLNRIPIDRLKIDASFVRDIALDTKDEAITRAIIGLGRDLGLEVMAEGVERQDQADFLMREGCHHAQGYLFGRPLPADELAARW